MDNLEFLRAVFGFSAGVGLGLLNFRWYEKSVTQVLNSGRNDAVRKHVAKSSVFRHVFIFLAGITLIWAAMTPPIHLCGGLLVSVFAYRWRLNKRMYQSEGVASK